MGVLDTPEQLQSALDALTAGGVAESDITVSCGRAVADRLRASTGRTGLPHVAIRIAERLGVQDDEMILKDRYEQALRDGKLVVSVSASSADRKALAAQAFRDQGGHLVNFLGRFTIEPLPG